MHLQDVLGSIGLIEAFVDGFDFDIYCNEAVKKAKESPMWERPLREFDLD